MESCQADSRHSHGGKRSRSSSMETTIFGDEFLLPRPLLRAIRYQGPGHAVLLIDEIDRADEEFEAFLLEVLSDFQVTVPEFGTFEAKRRPFVVLTSNRTRELNDALKRRCLYLWIEYPTQTKEREIVMRKVPGIESRLANRFARSCTHCVKSSSTSGQASPRRSTGREPWRDQKLTASTRRSGRNCGLRTQIQGRHRAFEIDRCGPDIAGQQSVPHRLGMVVMEPANRSRDPGLAAKFRPSCSSVA